MRRSLVAASLLLAACAPRYHVSSTSDPFERTTVRRMRGNALGGRYAGGDWVALGAEETRTGADTARWALVVDYRTQGDWLDIRPGASLVLLVDGDRVALSGAGSVRSRDETRGARREVARFPAAAALVRRMAAARDVRVRLIGARYHVDRVFSRANLERFRRFAGVEATPAPGTTGGGRPAAAPAHPAPASPPAAG